MKSFMQVMMEMNSGLVSINDAKAKRLVTHYMNPVANLKAQEKSLGLTPKEMDALGQIERASQKVGMNLRSSLVNIQDVDTYLNLLNTLQKTDLKRIANYIDNIRLSVEDDFS